MSAQEFYDYIIENFSVGGAASRIINNILQYVDELGLNEDESYQHLHKLLDGTIGLTEEEIGMCNFGGGQ